MPSHPFTKVQIAQFKKDRHLNQIIAATCQLVTKHPQLAPALIASNPNINPKFAAAIATAAKKATN